MSIEVPEGDYIIYNGYRIWWQANQPTRIHQTCNDPVFYDPANDRRGMRIQFDGWNVRSADFDPGNFRRWALQLQAAGKSAPGVLPPLASRRLTDRGWTWTGE